MAMSFLAQHNDLAAREFMARGIAEEMGFEILDVLRAGTDGAVLVKLQCRKPGRSEIVTVEEPFPADFPSDTWKQRLMVLA